MDNLKEEIKKSAIDKIAFVSLGIYLFLFSVVAVLRYHFFSFVDFDFAIYAQVMWNMLHETLHSSLLGVSFLENHISLILFFIFPFYFVLKTPACLLVFQVFAIFVGGHLFYRFASQIIGRAWAVALLALYLTYPPLIYANLYEFHPVVLTIPFLMLALISYQKKEFAIFLLSCFFAMLCKENIPLAVSMFGILAFFDKRSVRWILIPFFLGFFVFFFFTVIIKSYLDSNSLNYFLIYQQIGGTPEGIFRNILSSPYKIIGMLFSLDNFFLVFQMFLSVAFFPLFSLKMLVPAFPLFLQHFLSNRLLEKTIFFHYSAKFVPFLFISSAYGLKQLISKSSVKKRKIVGILIVIICFFNIYFVVNTNSGRRNIDVWKEVFCVFQREHQRKIYQEKIDLIPAEASVASTFRFLPKLSQRKNVYSFHYFLQGTYIMSLKEYPWPKSVDYALVDFDDEFAFSFKSKDADKNLNKFFMTTYNWEVVDFEESTVLFKASKNSNFSSLFEILGEKESPNLNIKGKIKDDIELLGFDFDIQEKECCTEVLFFFYWKCLRPTRNDYNASVAIVDAQGKVSHQQRKYTCYRLYPTYQWKKGEVVKEKYRYCLPRSFFKEKNFLKMIIMDDTNKEFIKIESEYKKRFDSDGNLILFNGKKMK
ncbi:MAG: DUF2079 domain-containing protein [Candidatus Omnitrophica bacterium]|nr:DUF2079 domain-containing protein [Candidatus Omnitrophota bacterium]